MDMIYLFYLIAMTSKFFVPIKCSVFVVKILLKKQPFVQRNDVMIYLNEPPPHYKKFPP
jgi:hypothetical protein